MSLWTQSDVDALKVAVASGILQVKYSGPPERMVMYQSLPEMRSLLATMAQAVAVSNGASTFSFVTTSKGV